MLAIKALLHWFIKLLQLPDNRIGRQFPMASPLAVAAAIVVAAAASVGAPAFGQDMNHILVLHSYHKGLSWTDSEDSGIRSVLARRAANVRVHTEYLDTKTISDTEHFRRIFQVLKHKYAAIALGAVIATDDDAYNFYLEHHQALFPRAPVVFCGVNYYRDSQREGREDLVTGVVEAFDVAATVGTALRLHPRTSRVIIINDKTTTGLANKKNIIENLIPRYSGKVAFEFWEEFTMEEVLKKVRALTSDDLILMMTFNKDRAGKVFNYDESIALIAREAVSSPIFGVWDFYLGKGIVGGMLTSGVDQGSTAAEIALRILNGEQVRSIPVVSQSPNRFKFDYRQMRRFGIETSDLPPGSVVINKPISFYARHKVFVWGTASGFVGLTLIIVLLLINIRQRRRGEEALRDSEAKIRTLVTNLNVGVYRTTPAGSYIQANPAMAKIFGYQTPELLMGTPVIDIYRNPEDRTWFLAELDEKRGVKNVEIAMKTKDGTPIWASLSATAHHSERGEFLFLDGILEDITERKLAKEAIYRLNEELEQRVTDRTAQLQAANNELQLTTRNLDQAYQELKLAQSRILQQEKMASVGQLAAGVAHEINNPMAFIISNLSSLRKYSDKLAEYIGVQAGAIEKLSTHADAHTVAEELEARRKSLRVGYVLKDLDYLIDESLDGAERVKKIVQDLKNFSCLDEAELQLADINHAVESTINLGINQVNQKVVIKKQYGDLPTTLCNARELNQVFMNILVNAAQAIEAEGEIAVFTSCDQENIRVTISDTGMGIPPEKLNRIFEPFFTTKEVGRGTGLGLSIAYDIIKKHNGEIRVESELGKGTTFTIVIPIVSADA